MKKTVSIALMLGLAVAVSGCQRFSGSRDYVAPLPATPTTPVGQGSLQPLDPMAPAPGTVQDAQTAGTDLSASPVTEPSGAIEISRSDMAGGWKLSSGGDSCMAFMALTTWSGGYRANTRGCTNAVLSSIAAWNLSGKQVELKDSTGAVVAQLYATSTQQFNGQTSTGAAVSLFR
ncbi:protease inhibitor Inh/omp19 family protein [Roseibium litorale]|uniref:AprI/Inh family metalloprotease inhibitor n=1 Tax=Roseibium litorale TaxID=2803841 RepID=A0ABR9CLT4_9HYPH|nr:AprI/Inh family metalloprotease inhibitor [Roseibium litorale]MBD8891812.1 AprI/Inh family metalloprotease inhibitor [Roseibium litorale]